MKGCYCKQASGGAVPPRGNQETPEGPKSDWGWGWGCLLLRRQRAEGAGFLGWASCHPPADSERQSWHLRAVSLFCSLWPGNLFPVSCSLPRLLCAKPRMTNERCGLRWKLQRQVCAVPMRTQQSSQRPNGFAYLTVANGVLIQILCSPIKLFI